MSEKSKLQIIQFLVSDEHLNNVREKCHSLGPETENKRLEYAYIFSEIRAILKGPIELSEILCHEEKEDWWKQ